MNSEAKLIKLSDSDEHIAARSQDIRGRTVRNAGGEELGTVEDLLIDPEEEVVRFLVIASGGFLGIGKDKSFVPVEAVTEVADEVRIDLSREQLSGAPGYNPDLVQDRAFYDEIYGYYGYTPYWTPGYIYAGPYPLM